MALAGLTLSAALLPSAAIAQTAAPQIATRTDLTVNAAGQASVLVKGFDDLPAGGVVSITENGRILDQLVLDANGQASTALTLAAGGQSLQAVYAGDAAHQSSVSTAATVQPQVAASGTPSYQLSVAAISPATLPMTLSAGQSGTLNVTVTPVNNSSLTAPMFVTLSCSGLPSLSTCGFTPENVEITSTTPTSCPTGSLAAACPPTSLMVISTQAQSGMLTMPGQRHSNPVAWAMLLPGLLGLGGIAWGARHRRWLQRVAVIAIVGFVSILGTTACSPLYNYYNHGIPVTPATPSGTYTVTITAQTSNGVISTSSTANLVLTVK